MFGWFKRWFRRDKSSAPGPDDEQVLAGIVLPPEASGMIYKPVQRVVVEEPKRPLVGSVEERIAKLGLR